MNVHLEYAGKPLSQRIDLMRDIDALRYMADGLKAMMPAAEPEMVAMDAEWDEDTVIGNNTTTHDFYRERIRHLTTELATVLRRLTETTNGSPEAGLYRAVLDWQRRQCESREATLTPQKTW